MSDVSRRVEDRIHQLRQLRSTAANNDTEAALKKALQDQNAPVDIAVRAGGASQFIGGHNEHDYAYDRRVELTANR